MGPNGHDGSSESAQRHSAGTAEALPWVSSAVSLSRQAVCLHSPKAGNMLASTCVWQLLAHDIPLTLHVSVSALLGAHTSLENTYLHAHKLILKL